MRKTEKRQKRGRRAASCGIRKKKVQMGMFLSQRKEQAPNVERARDDGVK